MDLRPTLASLFLLACGHDLTPDTYVPAASVVTDTARPTGRTDAPHDVPLPLIAHAGHRWVLLATGLDDEAGVGPTRLVTREDVVITERAVSPSAVPSRWREAPRSVYVHESGGNSCVLRVGTPVVLSRVFVDVTVLDRWNGRDEMGNPVTRPPDAEVAAEAYAQAGGGRALAVEVLDGACNDASFAHLTPRVPTPFRAEPADASTRRAAIAAYRGTEAWRTTQANFREFPSENGQPVPATALWDEQRPNSPEVSVWRAPNGARTFVTVRGSVPSDGCGIFSGAVWAVYEREGERLIPRSTAVDPSLFNATRAVDVDGDDAPEFLGEDEFRALGPTGYETSVSTEYPMHVCPC